MPPPFVRWGIDHVSVLALTLAVPLLLAWWARRDKSDSMQRVVCYAFAALLIGESVAKLAWLRSITSLTWGYTLPLHLCDWALAAVVVACLTRRQTPYELAYFWGLAGTMQGLLTPDLDYGFPSPQFCFFFLSHGGIVAGVIFLTAGVRLRPQWRSVWRAYLGLLGYAIVAGVANMIFATNYGYLRGKPDVSSLLDWFGPWPWYIGTLAVAGLVFFTVLYLPWAIADRVRRQVRTPAADAPASTTTTTAA